MNVTRFAPSPTGYLHLGHAYSALFAHRAAPKGNFLLRIEDIDPLRCREEYIKGIYEDLHWLGLDWPKPARRQSEHLEDYQKALNVLHEKGLLYPCFCTRREIEAQNAAHAPHEDDEQSLYPGTCRSLSKKEREEKLEQFKGANWRLDCAKAGQLAGPLVWHDQGRGQSEVQASLLGDVVLARKDVPTSYHLSVTVDDHIQGITLVTRGKDLIPSTHIHRLLQALLGYEAPLYHHHKLLTDDKGQRYAKRNQAETLRSLRAQGKTAESLIKQLWQE